MNKKLLQPQAEVFWYLPHKLQPVLREQVKAEVLVIGGGMAGLSAAQAFCAQGKKVILIERHFCGAGASGKSSGFITPNAELGLSHFVNVFGPIQAKKIWDFIIGGMELIRNNIYHYSLICDYVEEDTLMLASKKKAMRYIEKEYNCLKNLGYKASLLNKAEIQQLIHAQDYHGGMAYPGSFGINSYAYCQEIKRALIKQGVTIYEETAALRIEDHTVVTDKGSVTADFIIVCTDQFTPELGRLTQQIYHAQTFLMISQELSDEEIRLLFPQKSYMVWDTELIYTYYRLTNKRLLIGGSTYLATYAGKEYYHYMPIIKKLTKYVEKKIPQVSFHMEYMWPGLIGVSKDIMPLAGPDKHNQFIYYIAAAAGLPIAAALGRYAAEHFLHARNDFEQYFSPYRSFFIGPTMQKLLGKKLSFAISNLKAELE